jgi:hypothetical protein
MVMLKRRSAMLVGLRGEAGAALTTVRLGRMIDELADILRGVEKLVGCREQLKVNIQSVLSPELLSR